MKKNTQNLFSAFAFLFLFSSTCVFGQWQQLGNDILGIEQFDGNGRSVALSEDGLTVAIGASNNDINGNLAGMARVFRYNGTSWQQLGADFLGEDANDNLGYSIALSNDGNTVAIGIPFEDIGTSVRGAAKIFEYDGTNWNQLGTTIFGGSSDNTAGWSIDLSGTGTRIVVGNINDGASGSRTGSASVYEFDGIDWVLLGNKIEGAIELLELGYSVGINSAGNRIVVGTKDNNPDIIAGGYVEVYDFDGTSWNKLGNTMNSEADTDRFGETVGISGDGSRIIIGAANHDTGGFNAGRVYIYDFDGSSWVLTSTPLDGQNIGISFGESVAISEQGNRIIVGAVQESINVVLSGSASVFQFDGASWNLLSTPVVGTIENEFAGDTVAINSDGSVIAYGAPLSSAVNGGGLVRVFDDSILALNDVLAEVAISVYPNPTNGIVQFKTSKDITSGTIEVYNTLGQKIDNIMFQNINNLRVQLPEAVGVYFLKVTANTTLNTFRILKK